MTQASSRKQFFAKLLGVAAVAGFAPKLLAKTVVVPVASAENPPPFAPRTETRAVARRPDEV